MKNKYTICVSWTKLSNYPWKYPSGSSKQNFIHCFLHERIAFDRISFFCKNESELNFIGNFQTFFDFFMILNIGIWRCCNFEQTIIFFIFVVRKIVCDISLWFLRICNRLSTLNCSSIANLLCLLTSINNHIPKWFASKFLSAFHLTYINSNMEYLL